MNSPTSHVLRELTSEQRHALEQAARDLATVHAVPFADALEMLCELVRYAPWPSDMEKCGRLLGDVARELARRERYRRFLERSREYYANYVERPKSPPRGVPFSRRRPPRYR